MTEPHANPDLAHEMAAARDAVQQQLGSARLEHAHVDVAALPRFSAALPEKLEGIAREQLMARVDALQPWLQGPFVLGGDLVIGGTWRSDLRWEELSGHVGDLAGSRALDVGSNAGYDAFMFHLHGADEVLGCEPHGFINQARFLEDVYATGVQFEQLGWQDLDPDRHGMFDLVHSHGLLYHEAHPIALLERLRAMVAPDGRLLLGSMTLADPEFSEHARFVPGSFYNDPTWWWVPGRLALRWMVEAVGFEITGEFAQQDGPPGEFATVSGYIEAVPASPSPVLTSPVAVLR